MEEIIYRCVTKEKGVVNLENTMDYKKREAIFSKECLDAKDFEVLFGVAYSTACEIIRKIKKHLGKDRLNLQGKIHVQDYIEWLDLNQDKYLERYTKPIELQKSTVFELYGKPKTNKTDLSYFGYSTEGGDE